MTQNENSNNKVNKTVSKTARTVFAAAISAGLVGVFALPAYSSPSPATNLEQYSNQAPQNLKTLEAPEVGIVIQALEVAENVALLEAEREAAEREAEEARIERENERALQASQVFSPRVDIPSGAGGAGMLSAALAQLGQYQDCTALVERSLRAVGVPAGDLGTAVYQYTALGGQLVSSWAPGDVLIWPGNHVAIYLGNGQAVHGGWNGYDTVVSGMGYLGNPSAAVRF